ALPAESKRLALAQCCELFGYLKDAAEQYEAAMDKEPDRPTENRAAADFYMRINHFARAEMLYRNVIRSKRPISDEQATAARRGLALALVKQNHPEKSTEALALVGLKLDEKGMLPDSKIADAYDEQLIQAKVLGTINHHKLRAKAIALLEALQHR